MTRLVVNGRKFVEYINTSYSINESHTSRNCYVHEARLRERISTNELYTRGDEDIVQHP